MVFLVEMLCVWNDMHVVFELKWMLCLSWIAWYAWVEIHDVYELNCVVCLSWVKLFPVIEERNDLRKREEIHWQLKNAHDDDCRIFES
jgi:hypothetical protein